MRKERIMNHFQRLLLRLAPNANIASATETDWSSTTFSGHRHQVSLSFTNKDDANAFTAFVKNEDREEIDLPGAMLAELTVLEEEEIPPLGHVFITVEGITLNN